MMQLPLHGASATGKVALIDEADFLKVAPYSWHMTANGYVSAYIGGGRAKRQAVLLHRFLLNPSSGTVDHVNGNRLDNRRANLRLATTSENNRNTSQRRHSRWPYKGVRHNGSSWVARIRFEKKEYFLGAFRTAEDAARAYDVAAHEKHGPFARSNGVLK